MKQITVSPWLLWGLIIALVISLSANFIAKQPTKESPTGFVLPPGDAEKGKEAFLELGCVSCHTVAGVAFDTAADLDRKLEVPLGGETLTVKTYGELVTAIIHPSEAIRGPKAERTDAEGRSLMPEYRTEMTVDQVSHLVHFLSEHYEVSVPEFTPPYGNYPYR